MTDRRPGLYLGIDQTLAAGKPTSPDARLQRRLAPGAMEGFARKLSDVGFNDKAVLPPWKAFVEQSLQVDGVVALGFTFHDQHARPLLEAFVLHASNDAFNPTCGEVSDLHGQASLAIGPKMGMSLNHAYSPTYKDVDAFRKAIDEYKGGGIYPVGVVDQNCLVSLDVGKAGVNNTARVFFEVFGKQS